MRQIWMFVVFSFKLLLLCYFEAFKLMMLKNLCSWTHRGSVLVHNVLDKPISWYCNALINCKSYMTCFGLWDWNITSIWAIEVGVVFWGFYYVVILVKVSILKPSFIAEDELPLIPKVTAYFRLYLNSMYSN